MQLKHGISISYGIGAGQHIPTLDENMLATGIAVYPFYIRQIKEIRYKSQEYADNALKDKEHFIMLAFSWEDMINYPYMLLGEGYTLSKDVRKPLTFSLTKGKKSLFVLSSQIKDATSYEAKEQIMIDKIKEYSKLYKDDIYITTLFWSQNNYYLGRVATSTNLLEKLNESTYKVIK